MDAQLASDKWLHTSKIRTIHTLSHIKIGWANLLGIPKINFLDEIVVSQEEIQRHRKLFDFSLQILQKITSFDLYMR